MSEKKQFGEKSNEDKQDAYLLANISNMWDSVKLKQIPLFTDFLDIRQQSLVLVQAKKLFGCHFTFFGGDAECERLMLGIFPNVQDGDTEFPITSLHLVFSKRVQLTHRDCLGAMMALQIKRECIGDIIIKEGEAKIYAVEKIADFLVQNLTQVGKTTVTLSAGGALNIERRQEYLTIEGTVASYRLDCIVAFLLSTGRAIAAKTIALKIVYVNHLAICNISHIVKPGDTVTIRGNGKFLIGDDCRETKKNRFHITVKKLL